MVDKIETTLNEIKILLAIQCKLLLNNAIDEEVKSSRVFQLTGKKSRDEIVKILGVSSKTITPLWQEWEKCGLIYREGKSYIKTSEKINEIMNT
ncbi:MAG TPA: hypothetical protein PLL88_01990 [Anaerolineaceae bacterium]|nr:hypothetical protein [Anaerolineaceae bacterium]